MIESNPSSVRLLDRNGCTLLHIALMCSTNNMDVRVIDMLLTAWPESTQQRENRFGDCPIHVHCFRSRGTFIRSLKKLGQEKSLEILERLIRADLSPLCMRGKLSFLPIHFPCDSLPFMKALIDGFPGAVTVRAQGKLPLHHACENGSSIKVVQLLFDQYPEAIKEAIVSAPDYHPANAEIQSFLRKQLTYVIQSKTKGTLFNKDENGRVLLHHALSGEASLGSVKLMLQGNPTALHIADNNGVTPVHLACQFGTVDIVQYLVPFVGCLNTLDANNNSTLHYACLGGTCDVVSYLVQKQSAFVSTRNSDGKIPFQLLTESGADSPSTAFVEAAWLLLIAHPETVLQWYQKN